MTCPEHCVASRLVEAVRRVHGARCDVRATRERIQHLRRDAAAALLEVEESAVAVECSVLLRHAEDLREELPKAEAELQAAASEVDRLCAEHERRLSSARYARQESGT